jgi:hypothetical protein
VWEGDAVEVRLYLLKTPAGAGPGFFELGPMQPVKDGEYFPPALRLNAEEAQMLCDQLWEAGLRPSNGVGSVGQLAATQAHLADMKALAFHALKMPPEKRVG